MTIESPLLTAFIAAAGAVLIAVIGLIASVHYRLGKLEQGQEALAQEDAHTREMISQNREMAAQENAHTRELIMQEIASLRERSDAQHAETMAAIQRLTDAFRPTATTPTALSGSVSRRPQRRRSSDSPLCPTSPPDGRQGMKRS